MRLLHLSKKGNASELAGADGTTGMLVACRSAGGDLPREEHREDIVGYSAALCWPGLKLKIRHNDG